MNTYGFDAIDLVALVVFLTAWVSHAWVVSRSRWRERTITYRMAAYREQWMSNMVGRDVRMVDALIQNSLQQGVLFFASTSVLLIGGLLAGIGAADMAIEVLRDFPLSSTNTRIEWVVKLLLVACILMFAFFKFAWSYRLFNYVIIMIGAAPDAGAEKEVAARYATKVARLHAIGARHFTSGLSAYFFALCALAWFVNAWVFIVASVWVSLVLYRRAFRSNFMKILAD